ncbi:MAG: ATP-binding protein, partial [Myxococcota bacterium]
QHRLQELCATLQQRARKIATGSQEGIDFLSDLIGNTKDPLQYTPKCQVVQMSDCVDLAMRTGNFVGHHARIHVDTSENFEVVGNMGLLAHVVINATENAVKNSKPTDRIEIRLQRREEGNTVSIYNTSSTTLEKDVLHVFDLDFTRARGGTGTGLAFSKWAVEQMDGKARAWSMPGKSTCFAYTFPCVTAQRRQEAQRRSEKEDVYKQLDEALRKQREAQQARWAARD